MQKISEESLRKLIDEARKARDMDTVKALGEQLQDLTGEVLPEFAEPESSGNPELDRLRKHLVAAINARDDECEANLREMIAEIEKEMEPVIPEVTIGLSEEEPVQENYTIEEEEIDNPFDPQEAELTPFVVEDYEEPVEVGELFKDVLGLTQIAALKKVELYTDADIKKRIAEMDDDRMTALVQINGIGRASAKTILEKLGYEV